MNLSTEDKRLLEELCEQHGVNPDKVVKLLDTVRDYEFKERRTCPEAGTDRDGRLHQSRGRHPRESGRPYYLVVPR